MDQRSEAAETPVPSDDPATARAALTTREGLARVTGVIHEVTLKLEKFSKTVDAAADVFAKPYRVRLGWLYSALHRWAWRLGGSWHDRLVAAAWYRWWGRQTYGQSHVQEMAALLANEIDRRLMEAAYGYAVPSSGFRRSNDEPAYADYWFTYRLVFVFPGGATWDHFVTVDMRKFEPWKDPTRVLLAEIADELINEWRERFLIPVVLRRVDAHWGLPAHQWWEPHYWKVPPSVGPRFSMWPEWPA